MCPGVFCWVPRWWLINIQGYMYVPLCQLVRPWLVVFSQSIWKICDSQIGSFPPNFWMKPPNKELEPMDQNHQMKPPIFLKSPNNRTGVNQNETLLPIAVGFFCKTPADLVFARIAMAVDTDVFSTSCCFHVGNSMDDSGSCEGW